MRRSGQKNYCLNVCRRLCWKSSTANTIPTNKCLLTNTGTTEPPTSTCFPEPKANSWMQECRKVRSKKGSFARLNTSGGADHRLRDCRGRCVAGSFPLRPRSRRVVRLRNTRSAHELMSREPRRPIQSRCAIFLTKPSRNPMPARDAAICLFSTSPTDARICNDAETRRRWHLHRR